MSNRSGTGGARRVLVVGVGDDGPDGLPPATLARIEQADLLVGGHRHLELFVKAPGERLVIAGGLEPVLEQIRAASDDRQVVVLASGDPCFYGIGPHLAERLGRDRVEIVPHVSSVALAFARLGVAWQDATVVSAHGRPLGTAVWSAHGATKLAVLTDDLNTPAAVAGALLDAGAADSVAWVFEHVGGPRESAVESTLCELTGQTFAALNVLVIPDLEWGGHPGQVDGFGLPEAEYEHSAGLITKPEVRAVSLSKLRLRPGGVLWDVGAGSGSLAIEAAGVVPGIRVYAVERSPKQVPMLRRNVERVPSSSLVAVIEGEAPEMLADLPAPDAVFIGGSGGRLSSILDVTHARISRPGRIVANLVTVEKVAAVLDWARVRDLQPEIVQISVSRGAEILGMTRLQAENPVTIVTIAV